MKNKNTKKLLFTLIEDTLSISKGSLKINSNIDNISNWDSLGIINIITALENEYDIKFKINDYEKFNSIKEIIKVLESKKIVFK
tara:strand:- start:161 stop:412 length:252 start_codon:yes stop_codon:yes gene_type:complete